MDDKDFFSSLAKNLQVNQFVAAMVETRELYNRLLDVVEDENATEEEKYEANELTKEGFYKFIGKVMDMTNRQN